LDFLKLDPIIKKVDQKTCRAIYRQAWNISAIGCQPFFRQPAILAV